MIQRKYYKTVRVIVDSDGGGTPLYIENVDSKTGYFSLYKQGSPTYTPNLNYRIDNGEWFEYDVTNLPRIEVPIGSKIYLKGGNDVGFNQSELDYYKLNFHSSKTSSDDCKCNIGGYITSLLALENFNLITHIPDYSFKSLFSVSRLLLSVENLITSNITSVGNNSFKYCFNSCTSLVTAPMFDNITNVGNYGFNYCFEGCTSLVTAPTFSNVTKIGAMSFSNCFNNCISLVTAPTFENLTYSSTQTFQNCFTGCKSLITTPNFRKIITVSSSSSFDNCFKNCTSLKNIIAPRPSSWTTTYFNNWVQGVPAGGTFYKKSGLSIPTGTGGIPEGWTVIEEA